MAKEKTESVRVSKFLLELVRARAFQTGRTIKAQIEYALKQNLAHTKPGMK